MGFGILILTSVFSFGLFAAGHDLSTSPPTTNQTGAVVTGNGSGFIAAWVEWAPQGRNTIVSGRASGDGASIGSAGAAIEQPQVQSMAIAHSPSDTLVAWIADGNVYAERLSASGLPLATILLTPTKVFPSDIAVAWNGSRYFVIWSTSQQLTGAFIAADGSSTPPHAFFTEPSSVSNVPVVPDMAWNGQHFLVVFGELPPPCMFTCPVSYPDRFRLMRVSVEGDAIDSPPLLITGIHRRAHVASSGAESLIALDGLGDVSRIIARDESSLTIDAETPLFRWYSEIASGVVWDGATYTVGWRYVGKDTSWIGAAHVARSGFPFDYRFTAAGGPFSYPNTLWWGRPSVAVNDIGLAAFAITETSSSFSRARLYLASEFAPMPPPPPAPRNVVSYAGGNSARIDWQSDDGAAGFVVEVWSIYYDIWSGYYNAWSLYGTLPGDARTTTVNANADSLFRVRAFGPGGVSDGPVTTIRSMPRRRAERP
jgi:hypothetical protein